MTDVDCQLSARFLGPVEIRVDNRLVHPRTRDAVSLMALLAANYDEPLTREFVAERLWPKADPNVGSHNLRRTLWDLKRTLGCAGERVVVVAPSRDLRLDVDDADIDVVRFDKAIRKGDHASLLQAAEWYTGPFYEGCADAWAVEEREKRQEAVTRTLNALATEAGDTGNLDTAMDFRRQSARIAPLDRPARPGSGPLSRNVDTDAYQSFQEALRTTDPTRRVSARLVETPPDPPPPPPPAPTRRTLRPRGDRQAVVVRKEPAEVLEITPPLPIRKPLPIARGRLMGRDADLTKVLRTLGSRRLVTLTGPGGVGKTRLALAVAEGAGQVFAEGAVFVELAALSNPAHVASTVAYRLALPVDAGRSATETILRGLQPMQIVVVLDNCDRVREEAALFAEELLARCPEVRVLATCRKPLQTPSETIHTVAALPTPGDAGTPAAARESPAVALFVDQAGSDFALTDASAPSVSAICNRLSGIPLAIEMAAKATVSMTPADLLTALDEEVGRTAFGSISGMARDRAVTSMVDWTYSRLSEPEKALLRRAAVFAGGWTTDAAGRVAHDDDSEAAADSAQTVSLLDDLVRKSIIVRVGDDRYDMLDTVRQVMLDRILQHDEAARARARHHAYFHDFACRQSIEFPLLQAEVDNFRAALAWCFEEPGRSRSGVAIAAVFAAVVFERDVYAEIRERLTALLQRPDIQRPSSERALGLQMLGYFALKQGDLPTAQARLREGVLAADRARDVALQSGGLRTLGEAEELAGDLTAARLALERSVSLSRSAGDTTSLAESLRMLGAVWEKIGNLTEAEMHLQEALALMEPVKHAYWPFVLCNLGSVAFRRGEYAEARAYGRRMLEARRAAGDRAHVQDCLELMARVAVAEGQFYRAARLYGAMMRIVESVGATKYWSKRLDFVARVRAVEHILGEDVYEKAYGEGQEMSWNDAIAYALEEQSR